jgi:hypothetical protein
MDELHECNAEQGRYCKFQVGDHTHERYANGEVVCSVAEELYGVYLKDRRVDTILAAILAAQACAEHETLIHQMHSFWNNLGWEYLDVGREQDARTYFAKSDELLAECRPCLEDDFTPELAAARRNCGKLFASGQVNEAVIKSNELATYLRSTMDG